MQKIYKILIILIAFFVNNVYAVSYTSCAPGEQDKLDNISLPGDENVSYYRGMASKLKYDITYMSLIDNKLYLVGWAFKPNIPQTLGSNATVEFILAPDENVNSPDAVRFDVKYATAANANNSFEDVNNPKYYDLTYWNCYRSANVCRAGSTVILRGGFSASIDLSKLKANGKSYTVFMKHSLDNSGWIKIGVANKHVQNDIKDKKTFNTSSNKVTFTANDFKNEIKTDVGQGRVMGPSGFYCDSIFALAKKSSPQWDPEYSYFKNNHTLSINNSEFVTSCRGGKGNLCNSDRTNGAGAIQMYPVNVSSEGGVVDPSGSFDSYGRGYRMDGIDYKVAYIPALWVTFNGKISIKVEPKDEIPESGGTFHKYLDKCMNSDGSKKNVYSVYYLLSAAIRPSYWVTVGEAYNNISRNKIADQAIIKQITRKSSASMSDIEIDGEGLITVEATSKGETSMSLNEYYNKTAATFDKNLMYREGNNFYVRHNIWKKANGKWYDSVTNCELDSSSEENLLNKVPADPNTSDCQEMLRENGNNTMAIAKTGLQSFRDSAVSASNIIIKKDADSLGNGFKITRYYSSPLTLIADPSHKIDGMNTRDYLMSTYGIEDLQQPAVYRWDICVKESNNCDDDVESANCLPDDVGTVAKFHEKERFKTCTLPDNNSGFKIVDETETDNYCNVACKDDIDIKVPNTKSAIAGQYFTLDNYIPSITGKRSCVTDKIDYSRFDNDLKSDETTMMKAYNTYKDYQERYEEISAVTREPHTHYVNMYSCGSPEFVYYVAEDSGYYSMQSVLSSGNKVLATWSDWSSFEPYTGEKYRSALGLNFPNGFMQEVSSVDDAVEKIENGEYVALLARPGSVSSDKLREIGGVRMQEYVSYTWSIGGWNSSRLNKRDSNKVLSDFEAKTNQPAGGTASMSCSGSVQNPDTLTSTINSIKAKMDNAKGEYTRAIRQYSGRINSFSKCFTWVDKATSISVGGTLSGGLPTLNNPNETINNQYTYGFNPDVYFDYEDQDSEIFGKPLDYKNKGTKIDSTELTTKTYYWNQGEEPNEEYSNSSSSLNGSNKWGPNTINRKLLKCTGDKCDNSNFSLNGKFYTTAYLKRTEEISHTYHLPQVYTLVPSGKAVLSAPSNQAKIPLNPESVPVNINTMAGLKDYTLQFKNVSDDLRDRIATGSNNLEQKFASSGVFNTGDKYTCHYNVINDIYDPGNKEIKFFYRPVDTYDISHPNNNPLGYNWTDTRAEEVKKQIRKDAENVMELMETNDKFTFTLTPTVMRQIRYYNARQSQAEKSSFADFNLSCDDKTSSVGYHCYSPFLSCLATAGKSDKGKEQTEVASCQSIFGNTLNGGYEFDIGTERDKLTEKQKRYDELNVGGGSP